MYQLPVAPLSIGGILDDGFKLFRASWRSLLPIAVVASLIGLLPQAVIGGLSSIRPGETPTAPVIGAGAIAAFVVFGLLSTAAYAVMLAGVDTAARTGSSSLREAFSTGVRRTPAVLGTSLLAMLALMGGFILLVIPGFYLMVALYPAFVLPVAERLGPRQSISRAHNLVKGSWWRTAGVLSVMGLIIIALMFVVSAGSGLALAPFLDKDNPQAANNAVMSLQVVIALVTAPLLPLTYSIMYAVYTDLRLRKDGGDLLQRVAATKG